MAKNCSALFLRHKANEQGRDSWISGELIISLRRGHSSYHSTLLGIFFINRVTNTKGNVWSWLSFGDYYEQFKHCTLQQSICQNKCTWVFLSYLGMVVSHAHGTGCTRHESLMCLFAVGLISKHVISIILSCLYYRNRYYRIDIFIACLLNKSFISFKNMAKYIKYNSQILL